MKFLKGYLFILGATTFWGIAATIAKYLFTKNVGTLILVQTRMTFSFLVLFTILAIKFPRFLKIRAKDLYMFALLGIIGGAGANFTYYFTIEQTNVATAILLQYLAPLLVLVYATFTGEEHVTLPKFVAGIVSLAGCYLAVIGTDFSLLSISRMGLLSGISSAFCWGFANVWLRRVLKKYNMWTCLIYSFMFATLFWMVINPPWKIVFADYSASTWLTFFGFAMISILIPHSLYYSGMRYLTASAAIITATFEPIVAIMTAFIFLHEILEPIQIAGALLVITAIALLQIKHKEEQTTEEPVPFSHRE
jgi:drug/metabolite transporter (DMT)-like permease